MLMMNVLNKNGYYFDLDSLTLHMTKAYEKKTLIYGSAECSMVLEMRRRFPEMTIEIHKRKPSTNKPISYQMMKAYIAIMPDADTMLMEFERVQKTSVAFKSPYKVMEKWFKANYPHYEKFVVKGEEGKATWDVLKVMAEAKAKNGNNDDNAEKRVITNIAEQMAQLADEKAEGATQALEKAA